MTFKGKIKHRLGIEGQSCFDDGNSRLFTFGHRINQLIAMPILQATYSDKDGIESIEIENDGHILKTCIRDIWFEGTDFDGLMAQSETKDFQLQSGELCDCSIEVDLPVRVRTPDGTRSSLIHAAIALGSPNSKGGIESDVIKLKMCEPEFQIISTGTSGWFEDELLNLAVQLPLGFSLEACITCGLSDYSPYGHGCFGWLACFRNAKEDYRHINSKQGIFAIWERMTRFVQETYYCDQFEIRPKGRGYRG